MNNLENIHAIEKYFDQRLSEQEMEDLEVRLLTDPMFRHEFETFRILKQGIIFSARRTTLSQKIERLKTWNGGAKENTKIKSTATKGHILRSRIKRMAPWAIAVSLLFLLSIPILMPEPTTPKQLFAKYFEPSPNFGSQASRSTEPNEPAREAYLAYDLGDYDLAAALFESHLKQDSSHRLTDLYHLGNCYLATNQWDKAVLALEEVNQSEISLANNARWYLALAYLRVNNLDKSKTYLQEIAAPLDRAKYARIILRKLE